MPSLAGPKRPQDRIPLSASKKMYTEAFAAQMAGTTSAPPADRAVAVMETEAPVHVEEPGIACEHNGEKFTLKHGAVVIAAITSCTNTSNPSVMLAAGLLAQKAVAKGLRSRPWVKTSLAPGSKVVTDYYAKAGVQPALDALGFELVGYGCTTCIGNSGPLPQTIADAIDRGKLVVASVLSGNRNFEGRVNPQTRFTI